jgi:AMP deaminase
VIITSVFVCVGCWQFARRFDHFNRAIAPKADHELRSVFLKSKNFINGAYFAEILKEVDDRALSGVSKVYMEPRVSIYGQHISEWSELAKWWKRHRLDKVRSMKWMVQFPRLFALFQRTGAVKSFEEFLHNCTLRFRAGFVFDADLECRSLGRRAQVFSHCLK